jgi:hypothetical protein
MSIFLSKDKAKCTETILGYFEVNLKANLEACFVRVYYLKK